MKHFLCIYRKNTQSTAVGESLVLQSAGISGIDDSYRLRRDTFMGADIYAWSNEEEDNLFKKTHSTISISGYTGINIDSLHSSLDKQHQDVSNVIANLSGLFSIAYMEKGNTPVLYVFNTITRVAPIYYIDTDDFFLVSTSAQLTHLVSEGKKIPNYSIENIAPFLNTGYYNSELTPYKNVKVLTSNSQIKVDERGAYITQIDNTLDKAGSLIPDKVYYDDLAHKFISAIKQVSRHEGGVRCGITGGKDSRLIVAGLKYAGVDFETYTVGFDRHPDVVIGRKIAKTLKLNHSVRRPLTHQDGSGASGSYLTHDLNNRASTALIMYDGMISAYENSQLYTTFKNEVVLGGHGGELVRGGFAKSYTSNTEASLEKFANSLSTNTTFLRDDIALMEKRRNEQLVESIRGEGEPIDSLDKYYLLYRCGRWSATARSAYLKKSYLVQPFFDNAFIKHAIKSKTEYKLDDTLLYELVKRIAPELVDVPFAHDKWKFEHENKFLRFKRRWKNRDIKLDDTSIKASFNWRLTATTQMRDAFYHELIDNDEGVSIYDIVDKTKVEAALSPGAKTNQRTHLLLWHLYTAKFLVSNRWLDKSGSANKNQVKVYIDQ